jgi:hypothetical protein
MEALLANVINPQADPVIILGMHRSGTSLVARLLAEAGIHMGSDLSVNAESRFFRRLNERRLRFYHADWSQPQSAMEAMADPAEVAASRDMFLRGIQQRGIRRYWGRCESPSFEDLVFSHRWGWKDPRTVLFLPAWQAVFPKARYVYLVRNGMDVAVSLISRAKRHRQVWKRLSGRYNYRSDMFDFQRCFQLWECYTGCSEKAVMALPAGQVCRLSYEELLEQPRQQIQCILECLEVTVTEQQLDQMTARINPGRLDNSQQRKEYASFLDDCRQSELMQKLGYR